MKIVRGFFSFWYHFIVGDDWRLAGGAVIGLGATKLAAPHITTWWLLPIFIIGILMLSLALAIRQK